MRNGDLRAFNHAVTAFGDKFKADKTYTLILRLRHNVIKTGVRMISLSYTRISLEDIAKKLQLDSAEDAVRCACGEVHALLRHTLTLLPAQQPQEYIVAKAIRDGVIDATIDREGRFVKSNVRAAISRSAQALLTSLLCPF